MTENQNPGPDEFARLLATPEDVEAHAAQVEPDEFGRLLNSPDEGDVEGHVHPVQPESFGRLLNNPDEPEGFARQL